MAGIAAYGTSIAEGDTPTHQQGVTVYTVVPQVADLTGPGFSAETIDVTAHDSGGAFREEVPSFLDPGELALELNFDPGNTAHQSLQTNYLNRTRKAYELTFPDTAATTWHFSAYVTGFSVSAPMDGKLQADVTLRLDGAPQFS